MPSAIRLKQRTTASEPNYSYGIDDIGQARNKPRAKGTLDGVPFRTIDSKVATRGLRHLRSLLRTLGVFAVPVATPLPNISVHVI